ncbi:MAG: agmatinase family protein [Bdellovibrionales bacterium]|nr:agmatinase family protein [Bdellovibrionales bacterium]
MSKKVDPNAAADPNSGIFGLPYSFEESKLVYIPVPWEATTSYGGGTVYGPEAILAASLQMDLFDLDVVKPYEQGLHAIDIDQTLASLNTEAKKLAEPIKEVQGNLDGHQQLRKNLDQVNRASEQINQWVKTQTLKVLGAGKIPGLIGGDHSVPFGAFQAAAETQGNYGILHFDAHSDTRDAYMGFTHSHASIMNNATSRIPQIKKIVQVGIRDFCEDEVEFTKAQGNRFEVFYDLQVQTQKQKGVPFLEIAEKIIKNLPDKVWISFDIDGLDPRYCPHTGTPVPGGLDFNEAVTIIRLLAKSRRKIIGFDVVEVAPPLDVDGNPAERIQAYDEWDANVGMRLIYKISALALASQGHAKWNASSEL